MSCDSRYTSAYDLDAMLHYHHEFLAGFLVRECSLYHATIMGRRLSNSNDGPQRREAENLMVRIGPGVAERHNGACCSVRRASPIRAGAMSSLTGTHGRGAGMLWHAPAYMVGGATIKSPMGFNVRHVCVCVFYITSSINPHS